MSFNTLKIASEIDELTKIRVTASLLARLWIDDKLVIRTSHLLVFVEKKLVFAASKSGKFASCWKIFLSSESRFTLERILCF